MKFSIIIVSHNRKEELKQTLDLINLIRDKSRCEIIVHLDGCSDSSHDLVSQYLDVNWTFSAEKIGASPSRNIAFNLAQGEIIIGLDDDSHPIDSDFFDTINDIFLNNEKVGILAMKEIRIPGWQGDELGQANSELEEYLTNEFIGCGFAIRREVYSQITGFPKWMSIYGEEACVSIQVLNIN
ncbi:glycosyltransferase, partial [Flavobacteriaceae bacterium]|nr:glycosyltransferase [Flavobacteriaceae bacterium]